MTRGKYSVKGWRRVWRIARNKARERMDPAYLLARWDGVRAGLLATIDKFGDDDLGFTPYHGADALHTGP
jgi:hypothetical protein